MSRLKFYFVNTITAYRLLAAPVLLLLLLNEDFELFKWLLALSFFTDAIDGFLARRLKVVSPFGSTLDSIGDDITVAVALIGLTILKPEFITEHLVLVSILLGLFILQIVCALIRYGKISSFHTYLAKIAAVLQAFFLLIFYFYGPVEWLFYAAVIITAADLVEEIILVVMVPTWEHNVKGIYWILKKYKTI